MWEAIEHGENQYGSYAIFRGTDAEGETCWTWTYDHTNGMTTEPSGTVRLYDLDECRRQAAAGG